MLATAVGNKTQQICQSWWGCGMVLVLFAVVLQQHCHSLAGIQQNSKKYIIHCDVHQLTPALSRLWCLVWKIKAECKKTANGYDIIICWWTKHTPSSVTRWIMRNCRARINIDWRRHVPAQVFLLSGEGVVPFELNKCLVVESIAVEFLQICWKQYSQPFVDGSRDNQ